MPDITITVSTLLANSFTTALNYYNTKHETSYTAQEMVRKLAKQFVIDTIKELRVAEGQATGDAEVEALYNE